MKRPIHYHLLALLLLAFTPLSSAQAQQETPEQEVNVYSFRQSFLVELLFEEFTAQTGIRVNLISASNGLVARIKAEGKGSPADILLTSNYARLEDAVEAGITQPIDIYGLNIDDRLPAHLRDKNGHWLALTQRARLIYISKERVPEGAIKDYQDLAHPMWRGKICTRSGTHDYNLGLFASFIHHWGAEKTEQWLRDVKKNLARTPQGNDRAQITAIANGICDIAIGNSYYYGLMMHYDDQRKFANQVNLVFPNQDSYGTHMNISGLALLKYSPNIDNAETLIKFMLSIKMQQKYAIENFEFTTSYKMPYSDFADERADIILADMVEDWGTFKRDTAPLSDIYSKRKQ
ncbi:MAG: extracellular solute-binding protein, partial [Alphaproteobacteria bacterium]|nr:extracellular solute-binding protein [Alphaproteobacteria bacterium]